MRIQLRSNISDLRSDKNLEFIEETFSNSLARFRNRVKSVQLYFEDVNGPKGGVDKECRCVLHLRKLPPVVIRDSDECWTTLVLRAANRAAYSVGKSVDRGRKQNLQNRDRVSDYLVMDAGP